jgi:membrane protease YdiL (CAAX protease family)
VRASGLDYTILRQGVIYGEGDDMLRHLSLMVRMSPIFPIVGRGDAPMRPVDARDVAEAVLRALHVPCSGRTYDVVGPDPLKLRDVVRTVAGALKLPVFILPTPIALMRMPVFLMERLMANPLSTRAQLNMLAEGLNGNPEPVRTDLGLATSPFTTTRIRPLISKTGRDISGRSFVLLLVIAIVAMTIALGAVHDHWIGMTVSMSVLLLAALTLPAVLKRLTPSISRIVGGLAVGGLHYALTLPAVALVFRIQPSWEAFARTLYSWRAGHSALLIAVTLPMIVLAEEVLWRGVVSKFLTERFGIGMGVVLAALSYAAAHWAAFNPVLTIAALGCGIYWGILYAATDDIITPFVAHLTWDVLLLFAFPLVH